MCIMFIMISDFIIKFEKVHFKISFLITCSAKKHSEIIRLYKRDIEARFNKFLITKSEQNEY